MKKESVEYKREGVGVAYIETRDENTRACYVNLSVKDIHGKLSSYESQHESVVEAISFGIVALDAIEENLNANKKETL